MPEKADKLLAWDRERRIVLDELIRILGVADIDMDSRPEEFLPYLERFVFDLDYQNMTDDDWLWFHNSLASYVAQVLIVRYHPTWDLVTDERGENYLLVVRGRDGADRAVSPMDVVHEDFEKSIPPDVMRMLAAAEFAIGVPWH
ncbi:hypothetical protein [Nocardia sp. NPDC051981]|uniref:hypothetical protein n=1 Tax=Nocardia sp. NPDC051981 TaxID=3155417 RepID=UPI00343CA9F6